VSISVGDEAPEFTLKATDGSDVTLSSFRGDSSVTLVFYPFAFSGICTSELCEIGDNLSAFNDADNVVLAISCDRHHALRAFKEAEGLDFELLADGWPHGAVSRAYGCFDEDLGVALRRTVVVGRDGRIARIFDSGGIGEARDLGSYTDALGSL
jgi:peroxiredoxin